MIKNYRNTSRNGEQRNAISNRQRIGMVHLKAIAVNHRHAKRSKWGPVLECPDCAVKSISIHCFFLQSSPVDNTFILPSFKPHNNGGKRTCRPCAGGAMIGHYNAYFTQSSTFFAAEEVSVLIRVCL